MTEHQQQLLPVGTTGERVTFTGHHWIPITSYSR